MKDNHTQHISQQFNTELEEIRSHLLAMGGLVEKQVNDAVTALDDGNLNLAPSRALSLEAWVNGPPHASVPAMPPATVRPALMSQSVALNLLSVQAMPFSQCWPAGCDRPASAAGSAPSTSSLTRSGGRRPSSRSSRTTPGFGCARLRATRERRVAWIGVAHDRQPDEETAEIGCAPGVARADPAATLVKVLSELRPPQSEG